MNIRVLSVSRRQPDWVQAGFADYAGRLGGGLRLQLTEVPPVDRTAATSAAAIDRCIETEAERLRGQCRPDDTVIALDEAGLPFDTAQLAERLRGWQAGAMRPVFVIGGADGLSAAFLAAAHERLSLSRLTLPHGLVRVLLAEAIYRAWSLLGGHPYHRGRRA